MEAVNRPCRICDQPATENNNLSWSNELNRGLLLVECATCGPMFLDEEIIDYLGTSAGAEERGKVACRLRERQLSPRKDSRSSRFVFLMVPPPPGFTTRDVVLWPDLVNSFPGPVSDRLDRALINLTRMTLNLGDLIPQGPHLRMATFALNPTEGGYIQDQLALKGFVQIAKTANGGTGVRVEAKGWDQVNQLLRSGHYLDSKTAFFAFNQRDELISTVVRAGAKKAAEIAGYASVIIDQIEHNDDITDRIIVEINRAKFVVGDMTGQRPNVYFEVGYAMGMGKPVIWCVRKDEVEKLGFDIRQFNHILWESEDDLVRRLSVRINATIR